MFLPHFVVRVILQFGFLIVLKAIAHAISGKLEIYRRLQWIFHIFVCVCQNGVTGAIQLHRKTILRTIQRDGKKLSYVEFYKIVVIRLSLNRFA